MKLVFVSIIIYILLMNDLAVGKVILCSRSAFQWREAIQLCIDYNGVPLHAPKGTERPLPSYELKSSFQGWTGDYTLHSDEEDGQRCGFLHINEYLIPSEGVKFAYCNDDKHYICCAPNKDGPCTVQNYHVYTGPWHDATGCSVNVTLYDLITIKAPPGDYWTLETDGPKWSSVEGSNISTNPLHSCGTVSGSLDEFRQPNFKRCNSCLHVLCIFDAPPLTFDFTSTCFKDNEVVYFSTSSTKALTSTPTIPTSLSTVSVLMNATIHTSPVLGTTTNTTTFENSTDLTASNQQQKLQPTEERHYNGVTIGLAIGLSVLVIGIVLAVGLFIYRRKTSSSKQDDFSVSYKNEVGSSNACINNAIRGHTNAAYSTDPMYTEGLYEELPGDNEYNVYVTDPNQSRCQAQDKVANKPCFHHLAAEAGIQVYALPKKPNGNAVQSNTNDTGQNDYLEPTPSNHNRAHNGNHDVGTDDESFVDDFSSDDSDFDGPMNYTNVDTQQNAHTREADGNVPDLYYNANGLSRGIVPVEERDQGEINEIENGHFEVAFYEEGDGYIYEEYSCA